jgi:NAD(P)-dependent dehydrogenase (short-subunit alcohol dehydrogenase family)
MFDMVGKRVLVTGGGTGIGLGVASSLARQGARVVIAGRRVEPLAAAEATAKAEGLDLSSMTADVISNTDVVELVQECERRLGGLDGLVNAAGLARIGRAEDVTDEQFLEVLNVNLVGAFRLSREVGRLMLRQQSGSIVHIGSLSGLGGFPGRLAYSASKHGLLGLSRTLAAEWGASGVRVNVVAPGYVITPMTDSAVDRGLLNVETIEARTPMGRRAVPDEMAGPVTFLLSDAARFVTGDCLVADGGWTAYLAGATEMADKRG